MRGDRLVGGGHRGRWMAWAIGCVRDEADKARLTLLSAVTDMPKVVISLAKSSARTWIGGLELARTLLSWPGRMKCDAVGSAVAHAYKKSSMHDGLMRSFRNDDSN